MQKIAHIGIAVKSLEASGKVYEKLLGAPCYKVEEVAAERVRTAFYKAGPNKVELLEAMGADSPVARFIEKRGEGVHHIAFEVSDIEAEVKRLKSEGFEILNETPRMGADNKLVVFVHPKSCHGVLVELCQDAG